MPSPVPVLLPFCLVPCLCFFPLMVFSVSSLCCCAFCILCYCSFAAFFLLCFPACIFVFPASLFSCSFYIVLSYPCNVCSFSLLCFKFVLQDLFIFLLPCSSPLQCLWNFQDATSEVKRLITAILTTADLHECFQVAQRGLGYLALLEPAEKNAGVARGETQNWGYVVC